MGNMWPSMVCRVWSDQEFTSFFASINAVEAGKAEVARLEAKLAELERSLKDESPEKV